MPNPIMRKALRDIGIALILSAIDTPMYQGVVYPDLDAKRMDFCRLAARWFWLSKLIQTPTSNARAFSAVALNVIPLGQNA